jgi:putative membrane protein
VREAAPPPHCELERPHVLGGPDRAIYGLLVFKYWFSDTLKNLGGLEPRKEAKKTQTTYDKGHTRARNAFAWVIVALAAVTVIVFVATLVARSYPYTPTMPYGDTFFGWWFFPFGFFFFLIFLFFIFRVAIWGWGGGWGWRHRYFYRYGDAREILRQRYASGEITKDQFEQMMRDLEQH